MFYFKGSRRRIFGLQLMPSHVSSVSDTILIVTTIEKQYSLHKVKAHVKECT